MRICERTNVMQQKLKRRLTEKDELLGSKRNKDRMITRVGKVRVHA